MSEHQFFYEFPHFLGVILKEWYTMVLSQMQWMSSDARDCVWSLTVFNYILMIFQIAFSSCSFFCRWLAVCCIGKYIVNWLRSSATISRKFTVWANKWLMTFHINKCEVLQISVQRLLLRTPQKLVNELTQNLLSRSKLT